MTTRHLVRIALALEESATVEGGEAAVPEGR